MIVILTCNGEKTIKKLLESLKSQKVQRKMLIIDSESDDSTMKIIDEMKMDIEVKRIRRADFNHGATRQMAVDMCRNCLLYTSIVKLHREFGCDLIDDVFTHHVKPVSYTHLDVYKRQALPDA